MLSEKQRRFVDDYLECGKGAEAARRAGYSPSCARQVAYRLLRNPTICSLIEERQRELSRAYVVSTAELSNKLVSIARESQSTIEIIHAVRELARLHGLYR